MLLVEDVGGEEGRVIDHETSLIIDAISIPRGSKRATGSEDSRVIVWSCPFQVERERKGLETLLFQTCFAEMQ